MIKDIEADIKNIEASSQEDNKPQTGDSLILLLSKPDYHASTSLYIILTDVIYRHFLMTDGTMMQLKNSEDCVLYVSKMLWIVCKPMIIFIIVH